MIEVDPTSIEGNWRLADEEGPADSGTVFTLRAGEVLCDGKVVGTYSIDGALLTFTTTEAKRDGGSLTIVYSFGLPGPLADPTAPTLLGSEIVRPDYLPGGYETTASVGFGEDDVYYLTCVFIRID